MGGEHEEDGAGGWENEFLKNENPDAGNGGLDDGNGGLDGDGGMGGSHWHP